MVFFPNKTIKLYEYKETGTYDIYGELEQTYEYKQDIQGDVQPLSHNEAVKVFGEIRADTYKIYLPPSTPVTSTMKLYFDNWTYSIIGNPLVYDHNIQPHIKLIVQKERVNSLQEVV